MLRIGAGQYFLALFSQAPRAAVASLLACCALLTSNSVRAEDGKSVAFLGVHLQNDNEVYEATSDAERSRMMALETAFKNRLEAAGEFKFVDIPASERAKIEQGQTIGECGGCEIEYGRQAGAKTIAWIQVQKISNLILNLNVYMADVAAKKLTFSHSVDIRGNTDESWDRSLSYLIKNYLLANKPASS